MSSVRDRCVRNTNNAYRVMVIDLVLVVMVFRVLMVVFVVVAAQFENASQCWKQE